MTDRRGPGPDMVREQLARGVRVRGRVQGTSMLPLMPPGTLIEIAPVRVADLRPGDVVAIERGGRTVCHVLTGIRRGGGAGAGELRLGTAGTSAWPDDWVGASALVGRVVEVDFGLLRLSTDGPAFTALRRVAGRLGPLLRLSAPLARAASARDAWRRRGGLGLLCRAALWPAEALIGLRVLERHEARTDVVRAALRGMATPRGLDVSASVRPTERRLVVVARESAGGAELARWVFARTRAGVLAGLGLSVEAGVRMADVGPAMLLSAVEAARDCTLVRATTDPFQREEIALLRRAGLRPAAISISVRGQGGTRLARTFSLE